MNMQVALIVHCHEYAGGTDCTLSWICRWHWLYVVVNMQVALIVCCREYAGGSDCMCILHQMQEQV